MSTLKVSTFVLSSFRKFIDIIKNGFVGCDEDTRKLSTAFH